MALEEIGQILFVEILKMSEYPGSPFSGNTFTDLVMFFFIPTVFIILVVYLMVARVLPPAYKGLRFLLGIAAYLFIIVGGYYSMFAYLAGPYFLFLILVMGLLLFFRSHFKKGVSGGGGGGEAPKLSVSRTGADYENMNYLQLMRAEKRTTERIKDIEKELHEAQKSGEQSRLEILRKDRVEANDELRQIRHQRKFVKIN